MSKARIMSNKNNKTSVKNTGVKNTRARKNMKGGQPTLISNMFGVVHKGVEGLNSNKFFAGLIMIILNIGSKFITVKFSKTQEAYLRNTLGRQILIFAIAFMGTKDIYLSLVITAVFVIMANYLFNEESRFCILPNQMKKIKDAIDTDNDGKISDEEIQSALDILTKAKEQKNEKQLEIVKEKFKNK
tara:strand:- start:107 stop:667 length:561 start_codon:yes stop_codon:yes gene_type:complete